GSLRGRRPKRSGPVRVPRPADTVRSAPHGRLPAAGPGRACGGPPARGGGAHAGRLLSTAAPGFECGDKHPLLHLLSTAAPLNSRAGRRMLRPPTKTHAHSAPRHEQEADGEEGAAETRTQKAPAGDGEDVTGLARGG